MLKYVLFVSWLISTAVTYAQNPSAAPADVAVETRVLNDGYSIRLIGMAAAARGEKVASYKLILRHPDGTEDLVWNPPGTEPNTNSGTPAPTNEVKLFRPDSGYVKDGILGALIGKSTWRMDAWWLRWDVKEKRMISMVMFFGYGDRDYEFVDGMTIKIDGAITSLDDQNRVLRKGKRYPKAHDVYEGQRRIRYWPIDQEDGKIEVTENAQVWPFVARPAARNEPPAKAADSAPPPPVKDQPRAATTPADAQPPVTPIAQTPAATTERGAPVWLWLVGILALTVIALLVWKRRASQPPCR